MRTFQKAISVKAKVIGVKRRNKNASFLGAGHIPMALLPPRAQVPQARI